MSYERITLIKKSVYDWLYTKIEDSGYVIGEGAGELRFTNAFPEINDLGQYINLVLPTVSIEFSRDNSRGTVDLGASCVYEIDFDIDIFARNDLEREGLLSIIKDAIEKNSIPYIDYNDTVTITPTVGYLRVDNAAGFPVRVETPGDLEKYRAKVLFTTSLLQDY